MSDLILGKRSVIEALKAKMPIEGIFFADNLERDSLVKDIMRKAKQQDVAIKEVSRKRLADMVASLERRGQSRGFDEVTQGVVAQAKPYAYVPLGELIDRSAAYAHDHDGRALIVVCDHLTDAGNLGAIARSAESVGASGLVIPNKRSAHVTQATYRSSAGAISHIGIAQVANISAVLNKLKDEGFWVIGANEHARDTVWQSNLEGKIVLVVGNEQRGISPLVQEQCDILCALPQEGKISSLNAAQASTVFMYEWLRQNYGTLA